MEKSEGTMVGDHANRKQVLGAIVTASLLMLALGTVHRALAAALAVPVSATPIAPGALGHLPTQIGDWAGEDVPIDEAIVRATNTDAHINRRYTRRGGSESVSLYVACGVNVSRLMAHRPEICYRRAGWKLLHYSSIELPLNNGTRLPCNILKFSRGELETKGITVLHYWIADGRCYSDVSRLNSSIWHLLGAVDYVAQVQIAASTATFASEVGTTVPSEFAIDSAPFITRLFGMMEEARSPGESGRTVGGR